MWILIFSFFILYSTYDFICSSSSWSTLILESVSLSPPLSLPHFFLPSSLSDTLSFFLYLFIDSFINLFYLFFSFSQSLFLPWTIEHHCCCEMAFNSQSSYPDKEKVFYWVRVYRSSLSCSILFYSILFTSILICHNQLYFKIMMLVLFHLSI